MKNPIKGTVAYVATAALLNFAQHANPNMLSRGKDAKRIKRYISAGADVTATNDDGETAAHIFARRGSFIGLHTIVVAAGNVRIVSQPDKDGMTPLLRLAEANNTGVDQYLQFRTEEYLNQRDNQGRTIAYLFAENGNYDKVIELAERCPDVKQQCIIFAVQNSKKLTPTEKMDALEALRYAGF